MNFNLYITFGLSIVLWNCAGSSYQQMAIDNPEALLLKRDSLLQAGPLSPSTKKALITAHHTVGNSALEDKNYESAISNFKEALILSPNDTASQYSLLLAEGQFLYKRGKKDGLWDAIEKYHKAARLMPDAGEPYYHIGNAYFKLGDKDFDLMIESYEKSLSLSLSPELALMAEAALENARSREKKLKDFWK